VTSLRRGWLLALLLLVSAGLAQARGEGKPRSLPSGHALIQVLDVGQGDSILIRSPEGKTALVDAGPTRDGAARLLQASGLQSLDLVVVSHHHSDHFGGMAQVIRDWKPRYFLATNSTHTTRLYLTLLETVKSEGLTAVQPTSRPRRIELGTVRLTILPQPPEDTREENNNSIGLRLDYGGFAMLMTGDSELSQRRWWMQQAPELLRDCTVLKLAHHGSHNGTDARWLDLTAPELAVVSLGRGNSYGHPHAETLSLLRSRGIPLLRTDEHGTITLRTDGRVWNVVRPPLALRGRRGTERIAAENSPARSQPLPPSRSLQR
jgi:competence protein ComEC